MQDKNLRYRNLQFLRFIAAFVVIFAHVELYEFRVQHVRADFFHVGSWGVDIFFVISGFIMVHVYSGLPKNRWVAGAYFFVKRVARVVPLYFIFTVLTILLSYIISGSGFERNDSLSQYYAIQKTQVEFIVDSLTFMRFDYQPLFAIGWTLQNEFWFYLIFALCVVSRINVYIFFSLYALLIVLAHETLINRSGLLGIILNPMMLEFVFGVFLYGLHKRFYFIEKSGSSFVLILLAGVFLIASADPYFVGGLREYVRPILWGGAAFFVVFFFLSIENRFYPSSLFTFLGDASYSMYLSHWLVVTLMPFVFWKINWFELGSVTVFVVFNVAVAIGVSIAVYLSVEKPITSFLSVKISSVFRRYKNV